MSLHRAAPPRVATTFQVGITYCDGKVMVHDFTGDNAVKESIKEYADMLIEALQPPLKASHVRHVRMVTLIGFDAAHLPVHHIHSGLIECTHAD